MPVIINGTNTPIAGGVTYGNGTEYVTTAAGTSGQFLVSSGTGAPTWAAVGAASGLTGGSAGTIPYQSAPSTTGFSAAGTSGQVLTSAGTGAPTWTSAGDANTNIGYLNIPQNSQSAAYTLVLSDAGKSIYHPSADTTARIWTIPANSSVAYPIGTAITFLNDTSAGVITISITTDTLVLAGTGSTGSRTLAANGMATAIKMTSTRWMISGNGLT